MLQQAIKKSEYDLGYTPRCAYWDVNPYGSAYCSKYNEANECIEHKLADGSPLPSDYNGASFSDCVLFTPYVEKNLKIVKKCSGNSITDGCMPQYQGNDTSIKANNPDMSNADIAKATSGCAYWRKSKLNSRDAYVLSNGVIIFMYEKIYREFSLIGVDVNGKKGPNKWGYDVFSFQLKGGRNTPLKLVPGGCTIVEKGGISAENMLESIYK